jgi:hypothetical protein
VEEKKPEWSRLTRKLIDSWADYSGESELGDFDGNEGTFQ